MTNQKIFVQGPLSCIDLVNPETGRSQVCNETLEQIQTRYPGAEIADLDEWTTAKERALCTLAEEITEERFMEMLEVLPPQRWQQGRNCESFELCEHTSGRITAIFCRFGEKYFEFQGLAGQSLASIVTHCGQKVEVAASYQPTNMKTLIAWSLASCARQHSVTIREIATHMGITLKRVREVRDAKQVPEITAWNFAHEIKAIARGRND